MKATSLPGKTTDRNAKATRKTRARSRLICDREAKRDTLFGRCFRIAPGFWPNITIVSTGEPSAEYFDRLSPRQLAFETRVLALGLNMFPASGNIASRFPVRTQSS